MFRFIKRFIFVLAIPVISCNKIYVPTQISAERLEVSEESGVDETISKIIEPYSEKLQEEMSRVLARNEEKLIKGKPESRLGNLIADIILIQSEKYYGQPIDLSLVNYGGIRLPYLSAGDITVGNVYELMPFDNMLVVLDLKGSVLKEVLDVAASKGGWPISGGSFTIVGDKAVDVRIGRKALDPDETYKLVISDYLANGGDKLTMLEQLDQTNLDVLFRDALIAYFEAAGAQEVMISAKLENRIAYAE